MQTERSDGYVPLMHDGRASHHLQVNITKRASDRQGVKTFHDIIIIRKIRRVSRKQPLASEVQ